MGAQNGKDLLVKVDMTSAGQFETVAGLRHRESPALLMGRHRRAHRWRRFSGRPVLRILPSGTGAFPIAVQMNGACVGLFCTMRLCAPLPGVFRHFASVRRCAA